MSGNDLPEFDPLLGDLTGPDFAGMTEEEIITYWKNTTVAERLHESERLRRLEWGLNALELMDKTRIEVIRLREN
ncbi:MAG: hypothetical protein ABIP78_00930 [Pyrinomonadaceae bacterium]